jgi:aminoglycoside phosphotransferase (APT) family kinase protein
MECANSMWEAYWSEEVPGAIGLGQRLAIVDPAVAEPEREHEDFVPKQVEAAWEAFAEAADDDVAEAVLDTYDDIAGFAAEIESHGTTLVHGDLRDEQIGLDGDTLVVVDWGGATQGHPVVELAWYMMHDVWRIEATHDEVVEDFRSARGDKDDPAALDLGMIAGLVMYGWILGHSAVIHTDEAERAWAREELDWWVPRVRQALDRTWSPGGRG